MKTILFYSMLCYFSDRIFLSVHRACAVAALKDVCDYFTREMGQVVVSHILLYKCTWSRCAQHFLIIHVTNDKVQTKESPEF